MRGRAPVQGGVVASVLRAGRGMEPGAGEVM